MELYAKLKLNIIFIRVVRVMWSWRSVRTERTPLRKLQLQEQQQQQQQQAESERQVLSILSFLKSCDLFSTFIRAPLFVPSFMKCREVWSPYLLNVMCIHKSTTLYRTALLKKAMAGYIVMKFLMFYRTRRFDSVFKKPRFFFYWTSLMNSVLSDLMNPHTLSSIWVTTTVRC